MGTAVVVGTGASDASLLVSDGTTGGLFASSGLGPSPKPYEGQDVVTS